ncbi:MAG: two-component sensor histidine kinase [Flavobacteriales bacterium]|nr:MAG: two-component sensor histidine kinase [Flavobacteriales bacterium]
MALRISITVAIAVTLIVFLLEYFISTVNVFLILTVFPLAFLASYIGFRIAVEKFIYKKIKVIYRTIHKLKLKKGEEQKEFSLNQIQEEVEDWDKLNKQEIERLKGLENYRREFVGNVSHELKTPIFNIQGYLLTLLEGGLEDPSINVNYLKKANKSVNRMISLIEDLDEISKLESGAIEMNIEKIDLAELIKEVINSLELKAKKNKGTIIFVDESNKPVWVKADAGGINQVLVNLIVNSLKYGKENGETLIKLFDMHDNILVEVADDGQGIAEEHLSRLFERFYRTDKGRARESGGTGLGLSIVKHIIEAHNQTINVRSTVDVGSTFSFTLKKA